MKVHLVVWLDCDLLELRHSAPFVEAARFILQGTEAIVIIHCQDKNFDKTMTYVCPPGTCWGWRYFRDRWIQRYGRP